jgi:hypothetical protein
MPITYSPISIRGKAVEPIIQEIFFANKTIQKSLVNFADDVKASTIITETAVTVQGQKYTGERLNSLGGPVLRDRLANPKKIEYKYTFKMEDLRQSRFNRDMATGAFNIESSDFNTQVLQLTGPKTSQDAQLKFWSGFSAATKASIAGLTAGAGQGSISASAKAAVAGFTADAADIDGVISRVLFDEVALGAYIKVAGTTFTVANIATEYGKIFVNARPESFEAVELPIMYAPYAHRQLILTANNSVGAAQQVNFLVVGTGPNEVISFNGVVIEFVPIPAGFVYLQRPSVIFFSTDATSDVASFETGKVDNDSDVMFVRTIYTLDATVMAHPDGVLYGG